MHSLAPFWLYYESCDQYAFIPSFPIFFQLVTFSLWKCKSLDVSIEEIFPGWILKFGRHIERVENYNFSTRDPDLLHACAKRAYGAIFFFT